MLDITFCRPTLPDTKSIYILRLHVKQEIRRICSILFFTKCLLIWSEKTYCKPWIRIIAMTTTLDYLGPSGFVKNRFIHVLYIVLVYTADFAFTVFNNCSWNMLLTWLRSVWEQFAYLRTVFIFLHNSCFIGTFSHNFQHENQHSITFEDFQKIQKNTPFSSDKVEHFWFGLKHTGGDFTDKLLFDTYLIFISSN